MGQNTDFSSNRFTCVAREKKKRTQTEEDWFWSPRGQFEDKNRRLLFFYSSLLSQCIYSWAMTRRGIYFGIKIIIFFFFDVDFVKDRALYPRNICLLANLRKKRWNNSGGCEKSIILWIFSIGVNITANLYLLTDYWITFISTLSFFSKNPID